MPMTPDEWDALKAFIDAKIALRIEEAFRNDCSFETIQLWEAEKQAKLVLGVR